MLFNLDVSLEWDARNDGPFLAQLEEALQRTSAVLYDVSDGQMALGAVRLHQNKEDWANADVVIYASSSIHPRASMGGVVITPTAEIGVSGVISNAYLPGQIRMGPNWDPFGQSQVELSEDWSRALAHELAHYLLFLPDNYLGVASGLLRVTDCQGSFMTNAYDSEGYSEFLPRGAWQGDCLQTVAQRLTGRTDWETIGRFFPWLNIPSRAEQINPGPTQLPIQVTQVIQVHPAGVATTLPPRHIDLRNQAGELVNLRQGQAYLFKTNDPADLTDDLLLALGGTGNGADRIKLRGAQTGDRLCLFAANEQPPPTGLSVAQRRKRRAHRVACPRLAAGAGGAPGQLAHAGDQRDAGQRGGCVARTGFARLWRAHGHPAAPGALGGYAALGA